MRRPTSAAGRPAGKQRRLASRQRIAAIKRGTHLGRKPKLDDHQHREAIKRLKAGESCRAIAKTFRVHHATISRLGA